MNMINILIIALLILAATFTLTGAIDQAFQVFCMAALIVLAEYVYNKKRDLDK